MLPHSTHLYLAMKAGICTQAGRTGRQMRGQSLRAGAPQLTRHYLNILHVLSLVVCLCRPSHTR